MCTFANIFLTLLFYAALGLMAWWAVTKIPDEGPKKIGIYFVLILAVLVILGLAMRQIPIFHVCPLT